MGHDQQCFYLIVKALKGNNGIDKSQYGQLSSMSYSELMEKSTAVGVVEDKEPIFYDSRGNKIGRSYIVGGEEAEIASQISVFFLLD